LEINQSNHSKDTATSSAASHIKRGNSSVYFLVIRSNFVCTRSGTLSQCSSLIDELTEVDRGNLSTVLPDYFVCVDKNSKEDVWQGLLHDSKFRVFIRKRLRCQNNNSVTIRLYIYF